MLSSRHSEKYRQVCNKFFNFSLMFISISLILRATVWRDNDIYLNNCIACVLLKALAISIAYFLISSPSEKHFFARVISKETA